MWDGEAEQTMDAINELAVRCGGCDTVCMLSNIMCYCTDEQVRRLASVSHGSRS